MSTNPTRRRVSPVAAVSSNLHMKSTRLSHAQKLSHAPSSSSPSSPAAMETSSTHHSGCHHHHHHHTHEEPLPQQHTLRERFIEARHLLQETTEQIETIVLDEFQIVKNKTEQIEHAVMDEFKIAKKALMMYVGSIEEAPIFMRFNQYIHGGYRIDVSHWRDVLQSLFSLHNESVNIWSHLIGFLLMIAFFCYTLFTFEFINTSDLVIFALFFLGSCAMFLLSTLYHLFNCTSDHRVFTHLLTCDYIGIFSMILGSAVSGFHFAFHCFWVERTIYQLAICIICVVGVCSVAIPRFTLKDNARILFYLFSVSFTALPIAHIGVEFGIYDTTDWWIQLGLYASGLFAYVLKFPESRFPGKFDFWFSSHQLWHFFILFGGCWHYYIIATLYHQRIQQGCPVH